MRAPLWLKVEGKGAKVTVSLARCRNCGEVKVTSNPCGFDHLAALMEFGNAYPTAPDPATITPDNCGGCGGPACGECRARQEHVEQQNAEWWADE